MKIFNQIAYSVMWYPRLVVIVAAVFFYVIMFSGCATTIVKEKPITIVDTVETPKPVPCKVEGLYCSFEGKQYLPTYNLLKCLIIHKRIIEICAGKNKEVPFNADTDTIKDYLQKETESIDAQLLNN